MDNSNLKGQLTQAEGQLAAAEANLQKLINGNRAEDIATAKAQLAEQEANLQKLLNGNRSQDIAQAQSHLKDNQYALRQAEDDLQRNQELYNQGAIALQSLNNFRTIRDRAQTQVNQAEQALSLMRVGSRPEDITQARAVIKQKQEALALLEVGSRPEDIDQARAVVKQKQEALALLEAGSRVEDIAQAKAQLLTAAGNVQTVQALINDTIIRAPFSGLIARKFADPGSFVTPTTTGSSVSSATSSSILALASTNQIVAQVAEANISQIRIGLAATIQADAYPGKTFTGKVIQIATQSDVVQNVTSFQVKTSVSDPQLLLRSGMNVNVEFKAGELKDVLVVPTAAIVQQPNAQGVFVTTKDNATPVFVPIKVGITVNDKTEVRSGLNENEHVLLSFPPGTRQVSGGASILPGVGGGPRGR
jgi:HlyD family secretion protein